MRALFDLAAALELNLGMQVFHGAEDILGVLDCQKTVLDERGVDGLGHHAQQVDVLLRYGADDVEQGVLYMALENVAGHVFGRRHVFQAGVGEHLAHQLRVRQLPQKTVLHLGVNLEGVAQAHLVGLETGQVGKLLVDQLRGQHRVCRLVSVGGGQVVVFAGVDDDAGVGIDHAREELVDEGALHVDVAKDDAVHRVVEHHVQPLHRAHGGDLGHAQARTVVGQADVAADLGAYFVQRGAHQAKVLLRGVGAAKAFGGGAIRHIVQQTLAGGTDHGDDVGALFCGRARLHHVFMDVAGGDDQVQPRRFALAQR